MQIPKTVREKLETMLELVEQCNVLGGEIAGELDKMNPDMGHSDCVFDFIDSIMNSEITEIDTAVKELEEYIENYMDEYGLEEE